MAKLYWRYKKNNKWTWRAAKIDNKFGSMKGEYWVVSIDQLKEEE